MEKFKNHCNTKMFLRNFAAKNWKFSVSLSFSILDYFERSWSNHYCVQGSSRLSKSGKFLNKFFENQWQKVDFFSDFLQKRYKNQWQKGNYWNFRDIFQWLFLKISNLSDFFLWFLEKFLKKWKTRLPLEVFELSVPSKSIWKKNVKKPISYHILGLDNYFVDNLG